MSTVAEHERRRAEVLMRLARNVNDWCLGLIDGAALRTANARCHDDLVKLKNARYPRKRKP